jgi:hypothetical protein
MCFADQALILKGILNLWRKAMDEFEREARELAFNVSQGYCTKRNKNKVVDTDLLIDCVDVLIEKIASALRKSYERGRESWACEQLSDNKLIDAYLKKEYRRGMLRAAEIIKKCDPLEANCGWEDCEDIAEGVRKYIAKAIRDEVSHETKG